MYRLFGRWIEDGLDGSMRRWLSRVLIMALGITFAIVGTFTLLGWLIDAYPVLGWIAFTVVGGAVVVQLAVWATGE